MADKSMVCGLLPCLASVKMCAMSRPEAPDAWWRHGVIYQIYPRSFQDSNGDGVGDLRGIIGRLDYLNDGTPASLGVDALWLSPIYPSPGFDVGYDVADYDAIDPLFGSLDDFDELVREAHRRGIRVILDLVMNHSSYLHPWFLESRSRRDSPKRDWYLWREAPPGRRYPNNWRSFFGGPIWTWDGKTHQFYLHTFLAEQPDLNWRNPAVEQAMMAMMRRWLDRGVDGFRLDVFNAFFKHADLPDLPVRPGRRRGYERLEHIYDKNQPELSTFLGHLRSLLDRQHGRMAVGELFDSTQAQALRYVGPNGLDLCFDFGLLHQPWSAPAFERSIAAWQGSPASAVWPCYVLGNHDQSRLATRYGDGLPNGEVDAIAKVAATLLLTVRGTPFLYYGDEIAMRDQPIPRERIRDTPALRFADRPGGWTTRDPARTPMQWDDTPGAGFSAGEPWLPLGADHAVRSVARQEGDPDSVLSWYRRLMWFRRRSPALRYGTWRALLPRPDDSLVYLREAADQSLLVGLNFTGHEVAVDLNDLPSGRWTTRLSSRGAAAEARLLRGRLSLAPHEAVILEHAP
ncbi:MAG: alpha-amylase family glycosyl hydrolase [Candidatus Limnocylindrales bacterium]